MYPFSVEERWIEDKSITEIFFRCSQYNSNVGIYICLGMEWSKIGIYTTLILTLLVTGTRRPCATRKQAGSQSSQEWRSLWRKRDAEISCPIRTAGSQCKIIISVTALGCFTRYLPSSKMQDQNENTYGARLRSYSASPPCHTVCMILMGRAEGESWVEVEYS